MSTRIITLPDDRAIDGASGPGDTLELTAAAASVGAVVDTETGEPVPAVLDGDGLHVRRADGEPWPEGPGKNDDHGRFHIVYGLRSP